MDESDPSPFECGGSALADSARNIALALLAAPEGEPAEMAALRQRLIALLGGLAEKWAQEPAAPESERRFAYHSALWKLRDVAVALSPAPQAAPAGLQVVLEAFRRRYLPTGLVALRPTGLATIAVQERLEALAARVGELGLEYHNNASLPDRLIAVRFPLGEQDNTLMACCALPNFSGPLSRHVFATAEGGPAYFFAVAADIQNNKGFSNVIDPPRLCFIAELLEASGWLEHPLIGPRITAWREHFGFDTDYLDRTITSKPMLQRMREAQDAFRAARPAYAPSEFDRDVPALWERLRSLEAPVPASTGGERRTPAVIAILNAGWSFAQLYIDDYYAALGARTPEHRYQARRTLNRLLAEGIAAAELRSAIVEAPMVQGTPQ
jgi:hypothetical protein